MSGYAIEWAVETAKAAGLKPTARLVLMAMAYHANAKWGRCYAKVETIAETTGCSRRTVIAAMADIRDAKVVDVTVRPGQTAIWVFPTAPVKKLHGSVPFVPVPTGAENGNPCKKEPEPVQILHTGGAGSAPKQVINKLEQAGPAAGLDPPPSTWHPTMPAMQNRSADPDDHTEFDALTDRPAKADFVAVMLEQARAHLGQGRQFRGGWNADTK